MSLTREEAESIRIRLERMADGDPTVTPVTKSEVEALREMAEYEKRNMGFFNMYVSPKQAKILNMIEKKEQVIVWGGVRSTKTNLQSLSVVLLASGYWPVEYEETYTKDGQKILKPTYAMREKPIVPLPVDIGISLLDRSLQRKPGGFESTLMAMIPTQWIAHVRRIADYTEYIVLNNGSKIWFLSAESGEDKFQSATFGVVVMDEAQDEKIYKELTSRVGRTAPKVIMGFHTNRGRNWAYDLFIKPEEQHKTPDYRAVVRISILENPFIPRKTKDQMIERWKEEGQYERRVWGGFDDLVGIIYKNFSKEKNVISAADVDGFVGGEPPKDWPIISGLDCHHTDKGAACSWLTIDPRTGRCYLFKEYESTEEPARWFEDLNKIDKEFPSRITLADPAIDATDNRGFNLWTEFRRHCTLPLVKAKREHAAGIQAVTSGFAPLRDENNRTVDGKPGLYILDHCTRTIEQIEGYHRKTGAVNDVVKVNDEFCDTLRYMMVERPWEEFVECKGKRPTDTIIVPGKPTGGAFIFGGSAVKPTGHGAFIYNAPKERRPR